MEHKKAIEYIKEELGIIDVSIEGNKRQLISYKNDAKRLEKLIENRITKKKALEKAIETLKIAHFYNK